MDQNDMARRLVLKNAGTLGAIGALAALAAPGMAHAEQERSESVVGTWLETVSSTNNSFPSFQALSSYAVGGGWISSASINLSPATLASDAYGAWARTGERSFRWAAHAFAYTPEGNPNGLYTIRESLSLDRTGQTYTGTGSYEIVNNGQLLFSGKFRSTATRVTVKT